MVLALVDERAAGGGDAGCRASHRQLRISGSAWRGRRLRRTGSEGGAAPSEPSESPRRSTRTGRAEAYDQAIVGYLLQIARELKTASGERAEELKRRTSRLIASLKPGTLRRLVAMGGDRNQRDAVRARCDARHGG